MARAVIPQPTPAPPSSFRAAPSALNREAAEVPSAAAADTIAVEEQPREIIIRPTGLRHGKWEAPPWAFWTASALVLGLAIVYALVRLGYLRKKT